MRRWRASSAKSLSFNSPPESPMSAAVRVAAFLGAYFAANAIVAFLPLWFADRALSAAAIGQILGSAALLRVLAGPGWGNVADRLAAAGRCWALPPRPPPASLPAYVAATGFLPILLIAAVPRASPPARSARWLIPWRWLWRARDASSTARSERLGPQRSWWQPRRRAGCLTALAPGWCPGCWRLATARASLFSLFLPEAADASRRRAQLRRAEAVRQQILSPGGWRYRADPGRARRLLRVRGLVLAVPGP